MMMIFYSKLKPIIHTQTHSKKKPIINQSIFKKKRFFQKFLKFFQKKNLMSEMCWKKKATRETNTQKRHRMSHSVLEEK